MSIANPENFFLLAMMLVGASFLYLPLLVILHLLTPTSIIDRYWKFPHFRPFELALCSQWIYAPLRTQMIIAAVVFPGIARKRKLEENFDVPRWYRIAALSLICWGLTTSLGYLSILVGLYLYAIATGRKPLPNPATFSLKDQVLLAIFAFCVLFFVAKRWWPKRWWPQRHRGEK